MKTTDKYLLLVGLLLLLILIVCFLSNHTMLRGNNTGYTATTSQNYLSGNAYTGAQTSYTGVTSRVTYGGESAMLPSGQSVCSFQRSLIAQYPSDASRRQDYQSSLSQNYCDPSIRY